MPPPPDEEKEERQRRREQEPTLALVDPVGRAIVRKEAEVVDHVGIVEEEQPERLGDDERDRERNDQRAFQTAADDAAMRKDEEQDDKRDRPVVRAEQADRLDDRRVDLCCQGCDEEEEAGGDHERTHTLRGPSLPRNQPCRDERAASQPVDEIRHGRRAAVCDDRPEDSDRSQAASYPEERPERHTALSQRQPARQLLVAGSRRVARHRQPLSAPDEGPPTDHTPLHLPRTGQLILFVSIVLARALSAEPAFVTEAGHFGAARARRIPPAPTRPHALTARLEAVRARSSRRATEALTWRTCARSPPN